MSTTLLEYHKANSICFDQVFSCDGSRLSQSREERPAGSCAVALRLVKKHQDRRIGCSKSPSSETCNPSQQVPSCPMSHRVHSLALQTYKPMLRCEYFEVSHLLALRHHRISQNSLESRRIYQQAKHVPKSHGKKPTFRSHSIV